MPTGLHYGQSCEKNLVSIGHHAPLQLCTFEFKKTNLDTNVFRIKNDIILITNQEKRIEFNCMNQQGSRIKYVNGVKLFRIKDDCTLKFDNTVISSYRMQLGNLSIPDHQYLNVQPNLDLNISNPQLKKIVFSQFEYSETAEVRLDNIDMWVVPERGYADGSANNNFYFHMFLIISGVLALFVISFIIVCFILIKYPRWVANIVPRDEENV